MDNDEFQQLKALNITAILSLQTEEDGHEGAIESERIAAVGSWLQLHVEGEKLERASAATRRGTSGKTP